jgi:hypothetical protein
MIIFKVLNTKIGKFRSGGENGKYNDYGKSWTRRNHLTNAVMGFEDRNDEDLMIVQYDLNENFRIPLREYVKEREDVKKQRIQEEEDRIKAKKEKEQYEEFLKLKEKFEK